MNSIDWMPLALVAGTVLLGLAFLLVVSIFGIKLAGSHGKDRKMFEDFLVKMQSQYDRSIAELQEKLMAKNYSEFSANKAYREKTPHPLGPELSPAVEVPTSAQGGFAYTPEERAEEALRISEKTGMTPSMALEGLRTDFPRRSAAILGGEDLG